MDQRDALISEAANLRSWLARHTPVSGPALHFDMMAYACEREGAVERLNEIERLLAA